MESTGNLSVIFVGCGGTFWYGRPIFSALLKKLAPRIRKDGRVIFLDPDRIEEGNTTRQWCNYPAEVGRSKAHCAEASVNLTGLTDRGRPYGTDFQTWTELNPFRERLPDGPVLVIVNVDNNLARLQVRDWALQRDPRTVMVVSGCELHHGQVYYGAYGAGGIPTHDWLAAHEDVEGTTGDGSGATGECGAQSVISNALTAALFAPALDHVMGWLIPGLEPTLVREWYWRNIGEGVQQAVHAAGLDHRMWTSTLDRLPEQRELDER